MKKELAHQEVFLRLRVIKGAVPGIGNLDILALFSVLSYLDPEALQSG